MRKQQDKPRRGANACVARPPRNPGNAESAPNTQTVPWSPKDAGSKLVVPPNGGQVSFVDKPEMWQKAVEGFLSK